MKKTFVRLALLASLTSSASAHEVFVANACREPLKAFVRVNEGFGWYNTAWQTFAPGKTAFLEGPTGIRVEHSEEFSLYAYAESPAGTPLFTGTLHARNGDAIYAMRKITPVTGVRYETYDSEKGKRHPQKEEFPYFLVTLTCPPPVVARGK